mgnify:FL=1
MFHFLPGTKILSLATVGCNLHCKHCQNWQISQSNPEDSQAHHCPPESIPKLAARHNVQSVAYTYTEPAIFYEYTLNSAKQAHDNGLKNVLVTAGYLNKEPWKELCRHIDGANIDLKSIRNSFYRKNCDATLRPVLESLVQAKSMGITTEVTNLVIPTLNDSRKDLRALCRWIKNYMGVDTPLHFSQFYPCYRLKHLPQTPAETLKTARSIAEDEGLQYVYIGNIMVENAQDTLCPECGTVIIERQGYTIISNKLKNNSCPQCGKEIYGTWT